MFISKHVSAALRFLRDFCFSKNIYGALLIVCAGIFSVGTNALTHALPIELATFQILFLKSGISLCLLLFLFAKNLKALFQTNILRYHFLKGLFGTLGNWCWILAVLYLPLAQSSALSLTSALFTSLGGWIIFRERFTWPIWLALLLGGGGVYIILNPTASYAFNWYMLLPLASAAAFSGSSLTIKRLAKNDNSMTTLLYLMLFMSLLSGPMALYDWHPLAGIDMLKLAGMGISYTITQLCLIEAYTYAAASFIAPFKFARFPLNILAGMVFFMEWPTGETLIGATFIIAAYSLLGLYEKRRHTKK